MAAESPDFNAIGRRLGGVWGTNTTARPVAESIAEQLRIVWNARGAADLAQITERTACATFSASELSKDGCKHCGWSELAHDDAHVKNLDRAIRSLDR